MSMHNYHWIRKPKSSEKSAWLGETKQAPNNFRHFFCVFEDMPTELQKAIDLTLTNRKNTFAFLDNILIVTKGKKLDKLDLENLAIS